MISERIKAAKAVQKRNGQKFGLALRPEAERRRVSSLGRAAWAAAAIERSEAYRLRRLRSPLQGRSSTSATLNRQWVGAGRGVQLQRTARRLQLSHPLASLRRDAARARIQALWKKHPELTGKQVIASLGLRHQHLLGIYRARQLLRECRLAAAERSPVHRQAGWWPDRRTAIRIRIATDMDEKAISAAALITVRRGDLQAIFARAGAGEVAAVD